MKHWLCITVMLLAFALVSCSSAGETAQQGDYRLTINPGEEWLHQYGTFIKNPPQYAIWMEDASGTYLGSLFVTRKIATEGWIFNGGNRRVEALPVWSHRRNITDGEGFLVPSKENPWRTESPGQHPKGNRSFCSGRLTRMEASGSTLRSTILRISMVPGPRTLRRKMRTGVAARGAAGSRRWYTGVSSTLPRPAAGP